MITVAENRLSTTIRAPCKESAHHGHGLCAAIIITKTARVHPTIDPTVVIRIDIVARCTLTREHTEVFKQFRLHLLAISRPR
jgi:hypothetical protein